jgi:ankyrin repeat protein
MHRLLVLPTVLGALLYGAGAESLLTAIRNGEHAQVQQLLRRGADVNAAGEDGTTALMHAAIESDEKMMRLLVDAGADVNAKNASDSTALLYAVTDLHKTRVLLDAGADANVTNKRGFTAASVAVTAFGSTPVLKLLAAKGVMPEDRNLAPAAQKGDVEAMRYLLGLGVSPGGADSGPLIAALGARCDACVRLLIENGAPATGNRVMSQIVRRAMTDLAPLMVTYGASLDETDREHYTLLMQAVLSMEPAPQRDRMVSWLLAQGVDPNEHNDRGEGAYQLAARLGAPSTMALLLGAGARPVVEPWPAPAGTATAKAAVAKVLTLLEMSGEEGFKNRSCITCHNNSLPQMAIALARHKGFTINEAQAKKELGFAVATEKPFFDTMRMGTSIGGGSDTVGYTLMGMAAAGYPADALTDSHIHYLSIQQYPDGPWRTTSYRPPTEYSPLTTTAVALRSIQLYPMPGRKQEFAERVARARRWLLSAAAQSSEEQSMQLNALSSAGASVAEKAPFVTALKMAQHADGSWSQLPGTRADAYATGEAMYALHFSGGVPVMDPAYQKGVEWLLKNQMADGSWFVPTRTAPLQPHTYESGFPHGWHQFISSAGSSWAAMALLFTLPDGVPPEPRPAGTAAAALTR